MKLAEFYLTLRCTPPMSTRRKHCRILYNNFKSVEDIRISFGRMSSSALIACLLWWTWKFSMTEIMCTRKMEFIYRSRTLDDCELIKKVLTDITLWTSNGVSETLKALWVVQFYRRRSIMREPYKTEMHSKISWTFQPFMARASCQKRKTKND